MAACSDTTRLFLALWPEPAMRDALRERRDAWTWPKSAAPVPTPKLHLTLHFLGNQPSASVATLADGLAVPFTPFELALGRPVLWPHGIAVLEPHTEPEPLLQLHAALGEALVGLGLEPEARKFRPHVTLARRAGNAAPPLQGPPIDWAVRGYALVESQPGHGGVYKVLRHYA
jgi:2'-5' RNA ligase